MSEVRVLPIGRKEAKSAARIRPPTSKRPGDPIGPCDVLIAGTAAANGATLFARNTRELDHVSGLAVESWC